mmetsp:Transcript_77460/g.155218  ORF Transcript_77460/g.155218 Transcript_77460/m.155218 type:complete len:527 (-) Transcript_77460:403-1983(-)
MKTAINTVLSKPRSTISLRLLPLALIPKSTREALTAGGVPHYVVDAAIKITLHVVPPGAPMRTAKRDALPPPPKPPPSVEPVQLPSVDDDEREADSDGDNDDPVIDLSGGGGDLRSSNSSSNSDSDPRSSKITTKDTDMEAKRKLLAGSSVARAAIIDRLETFHDAEISTKKSLMSGQDKKKETKSSRTTTMILADEMHGQSFDTSSCKFFKNAVVAASQTRAGREKAKSCIAGHISLPRQGVPAGSAGGGCGGGGGGGHTGSGEKNSDLSFAPDLQKQLRVSQAELAVCIKNRLAATKKLAALRGARLACLGASIRAVSLPKQTHVAANSSIADAVAAEAGDLDLEIAKAAEIFMSCCSKVKDVEHRRGLLCSQLAGTTSSDSVLTAVANPAPIPVVEVAAATSPASPAPTMSTRAVIFGSGPLGMTITGVLVSDAPAGGVAHCSGVRTGDTIVAVQGGEAGASTTTVISQDQFMSTFRSLAWPVTITFRVACTAPPAAVPVEPAAVAALPTSLSLSQSSFFANS